MPGGLLRISAFTSRQLQKTILGMKQLDKDTARELRKQTRQMIAPEWQKAVRENASTRLEHRVLAKTARVSVSSQNVTLKSASLSRKLSGGLVPSRDFPGVEFGGTPKKTTYTATSTKGRKFKVTRNTRAQLRPRRRSGYAVFPAAADVIPRLASLWIQTVMRTLHETIEDSTSG